MRELTESIQSLMDIETAHPGLLSRPLLAYLKEWLASGKVCQCKACIAARKCIELLKGMLVRRP